MLDFVRPLNGLADVKKTRKPDMVACGGEVTPFVAQLGGCYYSEGVISSRSSNRSLASKCDVDSAYTKMSGTSQSAPFVSGMAALVIEALRKIPESDKLSAQEFQNSVHKLLVKSCEKSGLPAQGDTGARPSEALVGRGLPDWREIERLLGRLKSGGLSFKQLRR